MRHVHLVAGALGFLIVRLAAVVAVAQSPASDHVNDYPRADIEYGAGIYATQCSNCHGPTGDAVTGIDLKAGKFRTAITDQDLTRVVTTGIPQSGMPPFKFTTAEVTGVVAYVRNMNSFDPASVKPGDAVRGRATFEAKGGCLTCHRVGTRGPKAAPDLTTIGATRSAGSLQRSLNDPSSQMMPINRPIRAVTKAGTVVNGRRLNEDTYTVQIIDDRERLVSLVKAELREYTILTTSPMPSFADKLTGDELADVIAYLLSLKGS